MDLTGMLVFAAALMAVTAAPGPMVAVIVTRVLGRDVVGATSFAAGVCAGDMVAIVIIALGIGEWTQSSPEWLIVLNVGGVGYLLWLALQMWRDSARALGAASPRRSGAAAVGAGFALSLGSPATFLFYLMLLPSVSPQGLAEAAVLGPILLVSLVAVGAALGAMILLAAQLRRVLVSQNATAIFGRSMALLMATAAVSMLVA